MKKLNAAFAFIFLLVLGWLKPDLMPPIPQAERDGVSRRQLWIRFFEHLGHVAVGYCFHLHCGFFVS